MIEMKCQEKPVVNGLHECERCGALWLDSEGDKNWKPFECPERGGWCLDFPFPSDMKQVGKVWRAGDGTIYVSVGKWGMALTDLPAEEVKP